jgi:hypothetical protein
MHLNLSQKRNRFFDAERTFLIALFLWNCATLYSAPANSAGGPVSISVDLRGLDDRNTRAPVFDVEFQGNASRLSAYLGASADSDVPDGVALDDARRLPNGYLAARFPYFWHLRVGNLFFGYECSGGQLKELAIRGSDGAIRYQFEQTIELVAELLRGGMKPRFALTGIPKALVPQGERLITHAAYGCVNAPAIDWSKREPKYRVADWWMLQDAFMTALIARFGRDEVTTWGFATWTEPFNVERKPNAHLVLPKSIVEEGRHDEAVATIVSASIDVAMKHGLPIHIGNLAGPVEETYPRLMNEIRRFPKGDAYLQYIDGYAISRYRVKPNQDLGLQIDRALGLLQNPAMPDKPMFIDEFGELVDDQGITPFGQATSIQGVRLIGAVLTRVFNRQDGTARVPKRVAFWQQHIAPRSKNSFARYDDFLKTPAANLAGMFASLNGFRKIDVGSAAGFAAAGTRGGAVKAVLVPALIPAAEAPMRDSMGSVHAGMDVVLRGLKPNANYRVLLSMVDSRHGNPISAFTDNAADYRLDRQRFANDGKKWKFSSQYWERCYFDEGKECAWREAAHRIAAPLFTSLLVRSDESGSVKVPTGKADILAIMLDVVEAASSCSTDRQPVVLGFNSGSDALVHLPLGDLKDVSLDAGVSKPGDVIRNDERNRGLRFWETSRLSIRCVPAGLSNSRIRMRFKIDEEWLGDGMALFQYNDGHAGTIRASIRNGFVVIEQAMERNRVVSTVVIPERSRSQWHSLEVVNDHGRLNAWVDGTAAGKKTHFSVPSAAEKPNESVIFVGNSPDGHNGFRGVIDDLWIGSP